MPKVIQSTNILVVTGSVRPNSTNQSVVDAITAQLAARDNVVSDVADLASLSLPFFDATTPPAAEGYKIPHQSVRRWSQMVTSADAVIFAMPEYNRAMSAVQKNAIDWLYAEWSNKIVGIVAYGFHQGRRAVANFESVNVNIGAKLIEPVAHLQYGHELSVDGQLSNPEQASYEIGRVLDAAIETARR